MITNQGKYYFLEAFKRRIENEAFIKEKESCIYCQIQIANLLTEGKFCQEISENKL